MQKHKAIEKESMEQMVVAIMHSCSYEELVAIYIFALVYRICRADVIEYICYRLLDWYRREVNCMEYIISLIVTVVAGVICHYIIKWLDGDK